MTPEIATAVLPKIATVVWLKIQLYGRTGAHHQEMLDVEVPHAKEVSDMMDADDMETTTMDIEDNNFQQMV
ncbi:hypothetical protein Tco_0019932 [Tanacetum coccineum]